MTQQFVAEPVDIKKVVDVSPATLVKTSSSTAKGLMVILGVIAILFCVWFTIKTLIKPKPTQAITVGQGGQVVIHNEPKAKSWWIPTPYMRVYSFIESDGRKGVGGEGGAEWRF
jgi:hypothetical protein